jgi:hypothetical protein
LTASRATACFSASWLIGVYRACSIVKSMQPDSRGARCRGSTKQSDDRARASSRATRCSARVAITSRASTAATSPDSKGEASAATRATPSCRCCARVSATRARLFVDRHVEAVFPHQHDALSARRQFGAQPARGRHRAPASPRQPLRRASSRDRTGGERDRGREDRLHVFRRQSARSGSVHASRRTRGERPKSR